MPELHTAPALSRLCGIFTKGPCHVPLLFSQTSLIYMTQMILFFMRTSLSGPLDSFKIVTSLYDLITGTDICLTILCHCYSCRYAHCTHANTGISVSTLSYIPA